MENFNFKKFRTDFNKTVTELEKEYGISISLGSIRYDDRGFTSKLEAIHVGRENVDDPDAVDRAKFNREVHNFPTITREHFHREFDNLSESFKIVGLKPKARKYPIVAEHLTNGRRYKFPLSIVHALKPAQS